MLIKLSGILTDANDLHLSYLQLIVYQIVVI